MGKGYKNKKRNRISEAYCLASLETDFTVRKRRRTRAR